MSEAALAEGSGRSVGRPRDTDADERILQAALEVYGEHGWRGLTLHSVSERARVGKALLYSRFTDIGVLLEAAFERYVPGTIGEFASVRELLITDLRRMAELQLGPHSLATRRVAIDAEAGIEPLRRIHDAMTVRTIRAMRRRIHQAIDSGELPEWTSVTQLLDILEGAVTMHCTAAPQLRDRVAASIDSYIEQLVDEQLAFVRQPPDARLSRSGN